MKIPTFTVTVFLCAVVATLTPGAPLKTRPLPAAKQIAIAEDACNWLLARDGFDTNGPFEVSTVPPAGVEALPPGAAPSEPFLVFDSAGPDAQCVPWLLACFKVVSVVVIAGVSYYVYKTVCRKIDAVASNRNWQITNTVPESQ